MLSLFLWAPYVYFDLDDDNTRSIGWLMNTTRFFIDSLPLSVRYESSTNARIDPWLNLFYKVQVPYCFISLPPGKVGELQQVHPSMKESDPTRRICVWMLQLCIVSKLFLKEGSTVPRFVWPKQSRRKRLEGKAAAAIAFYTKDLNSANKRGFHLKDLITLRIKRYTMSSIFWIDY